jgi:hypothetical protein
MTWVWQWCEEGDLRMGLWEQHVPGDWKDTRRVAQFSRNHHSRDRIIADMHDFPRPSECEWIERSLQPI